MDRRRPIHAQSRSNKLRLHSQVLRNPFNPEVKNIHRPGALSKAASMGVNTILDVQVRLPLLLRSLSSGLICHDTEERGQKLASSAESVGDGERQ